MTSKWMPLMGTGLAVRMDLLSARQAEINHGQSLDGLADRGGLGCCEALALAEQREWRRSRNDIEPLTALVSIGQQAEIEALRADKDRLDWLEQNPRHAQIVVEGVPQSCVFYGITCSHLMKLREAIDAARRK